MNGSNPPFAEGKTVREQLVAYLDGELDADTASDLENQMATDPALREQLNRLEIAWGLLDHLPRAQVDEAFTQSTLEMVAFSAQEEVRLEQDLLPRRRRRRRVLATAGLLAAGVLSFGLVNRFWPDPNEQLLRDLPVLQNLDQYRHLDDVEFLRLLEDRKVFPEESSHGG